MDHGPIPNDGWTEGDTWVYTCAVMHDIPGLMHLMGGPEKYNARLDEHFGGGHNVHSNEPSHHYGYLYDYSGEPWKTQAKVRDIAASEYTEPPNRHRRRRRLRTDVRLVPIHRLGLLSS